MILHFLYTNVAQALFATRVALAVLLLVWTSLVAAQVPSLDEARRLLREGQVDRALAAIEQRLVVDGNDRHSRFLKGVALAQKSDTNSAIEVFVALTRDYPQLPEPYNNLAVLYASQEDYQRARDTLLQAINTHPSYATAHENLGDVYAKMAGLAYTRALSLDTANAVAKDKLALIDDLFGSSSASAAVTAPVKVAAIPIPVARAVSAPVPVPVKPSPAAMSSAADVDCDVCKGQRYNREILDIRYKGRTIDEVLAMTVEDAATFFSPVPMIKRKLDTLMDVGLSYVRLGQRATTLSGGEAQRVKLSRELSKRDTGRTLYILDEPTTGLHFHDIEQLLRVLHRLRDRGNTVIVIEHNLDVIKTADWVVDLGPEGGGGGGRVIAQGTPEHVASVVNSHTGRFLAAVLASTSNSFGPTQVGEEEAVS